MIHFKRMISWLNNLKLVVKIMLIVVVSSVTLLMTELGSRSISYRAYDEQIHIRTMQVLVSYVNQIETEFKQIDNVTLSIIGDSGIQKNLKALQSKESEDLFGIQYNITTQLSSYARMMENCDILSIGLSTGEMIGKQLLKKEVVRQFSEMAIENEGKMLFIPEGEYVWIVRQIRQIDNMSWEHLGTIVARLNLAKLIGETNRNYERISVIPELSVYDGTQLIYTNSEEIEWTESDAEWQMIGEKFVARCYSDRLDWTFYLSVPYSKIKGAIKTANGYSVWITVTVAVLSITICFIIMKHIVKHFNVLLKKYDDFGNGILPDTELRERYQNRKDEIGRLHKQFDKMADDHKRITDEHYNSMMLLKEAQFCQLQQQMQPHFMFNTLSTISWTAYENGDEKTARMAEALCELLRNSVNNTLKSTTVREEINMVNAYIYIQKIRYEGRFDVNIDMPENIMHVRIPPFTLQPIVENIIVHVVEKTLEYCRIKICGEIVDKEVKIKIEDSGNKLETDILDRLENGEVKARGNGVGLVNINRRIKLLYSDHYGLIISRTSNNSCVTVNVPYEEE